MQFTMQLAISFVLPMLTLAQSNERIIGAYIFHRHGDRTPKSLPPANLTSLGYSQVLTSGTYYRDRYVSSNATSKISGLSSDLVNLKQISASAPEDDVLMSSAMGFLQGLYPPVGVSSSTLRNGSTVDIPMGGYQLIPVDQVSSGAGSEDNAWLQSATSCTNAKVSSDGYFYSDQYKTLLNSTDSFYQNLVPVISGVFNGSQATFKNSYTIYDYINVAEIHNATIPSSSTLTSDVLFQLRTLADTHEWGLAYNQSSQMRAVAGMTLAGQILQFLNATATSRSAPKLGIQFGAYATFMSFFGLSNLTEVNQDFYGIADYASSMVFELFSNSTSTAPADLFVRFLFHNGTASASSPPAVYPLFGSDQSTISWSAFTAGLQRFAILNEAQWCARCGNTTGACAAFTSSSSSSSSANSNSDSAQGTGSETGAYCSNGIRPAVNGVIGAFVTLGVLLLVVPLVFLASGLRVVSAKRLKAGEASVARKGDVSPAS